MGDELPQCRQPATRLAVAAFVLGAISLLWLLPLAALVGVVLGHVAESKTRHGLVGGRGIAIVGLITSWVALGLFIFRLYSEVSL
jgi:hypothetical protein